MAPRCLKNLCTPATTNNQNSGNSKLSNNALNNRKILSTGMGYHVVWYTGKDISEKCKTEHTVKVKGMVGIYLSLTSITHLRETHLMPININTCLRFFLFETLLYNSSQVTLCRSVFKMLLHGSWKMWVLLDRNRYKLWNKWHFVKNKMHYTACLKKRNEREDIRKRHLKARIKPVG